MNITEQRVAPWKGLILAWLVCSLDIIILQLISQQFRSSLDTKIALLPLLSRERDCI